MLAIKNQRITISDEITRYDFVMTCQDLDIFSNWMYQGSALTNEIIKKRLWLSKNPEFMTVTKLDRLPRSLKRSEGATL